MIRGMRTDSESGADSDGAGGAVDDAALDGAAAAAAAAALGESGGPPEALSSLGVVRRRLGRTRAALAAYQRTHSRLLLRLREQHRRFFLRAGHCGSKEAASAAAAAREAEGLGAGCAAPPSSGAKTCPHPPLPLARFCRSHILLDDTQVLYVAGPLGPRLRTASDPGLLTAAPTPVPPAPAPVDGPAEPAAAAPAAENMVH